MRITEVNQELSDEWKQDGFDLMLAASGYEQRATTVAKSLTKLKIRRKVALGFQDRRELARDENDEIFRSIGVEIVPMESAVEDFLEEELTEAIRGANGEICKIVVDYTSMTRIIYADVLRILRESREGGRVVCYFTYTPSHFSPPQPPTGNLHVAPIRGFSRLEIPDIPTALIVGLGYEERRALGLVDYVEAAESYAFLSDPAIDDRFVEAVRDSNRFLLRRLGEERTFHYPLPDLRATAAILSSVALGLVGDYRVILAPLGPKPFTLLCLLLASRFPKFDVWRVSSGTKGNVYERPPYGAPLVVRAFLEGDQG